MNTLPVVICLILLLIANGAPILARNLLRGRWGGPIDGGISLADGRPVFGPAKTWRGVAAAVLATGSAAPLFGHGPSLGAAVALLGMTGDLLSSFIKRRLGMRSSDPAPLLDQVPEAAIPALILARPLELAGPDIVAVVCAFVVADMGLSRLLHRLGIRKRPD